VSLPPGLSLTPDGVLSGTPTTAGTYQIPVQVTDALGETAEATLQLVIAPALVITIGGVPGAVEGQMFTFTLVAEGGDPPYRWDVQPAAARHSHGR
jgi:hypothetical protein